MLRTSPEVQACGRYRLTRFVADPSDLRARVRDAREKTMSFQARKLLCRQLKQKRAEFLIRIFRSETAIFVGQKLFHPLGRPSGWKFEMHFQIETESPQ